MATYQDDRKKSKGKKKILETARSRFRLAEEAWQKVYLDGLDDLRFRAGEQWPEQIKLDRDLDGRPCLTINRIPQFTRQIINDIRQNRPSIKVFPVDDNADVETAKIYQGLIRHIEYNSGADQAYDTAAEGAVNKGFGFFRVITDYVDPTSFEQEILIKRVRNHFSVLIDPNTKELDSSDMNWAFIFEDVPKEDYKAEYGESELAQMDDWETLGNTRKGWVSKETCRIAEYFYKEFKDVDAVLLADGRTVEKSELETLFPEGVPEGLIISERRAKVPVIKWCKLNGVEVLEETVWPGKWIPIIPVFGDELDVDGEIILEGVVRHAKDSQRMYNYWKSTETETIALAPKAPFIVAEGQIPNEYEYQWKTANKKTYSHLVYKPTTHEGHLVPPPQRNSYEPPVMAITSASLHAAEDLKATTGIYDASLGARSNETSGVAIQRRNLQAQTSNYHFVDNLMRAIRHCGRILVDLIPKIYDTPRAARIIGEEGNQEVIRINQEFEHNGQVVHYQLGVGKYDVVVETGPSFATKRQEAATFMESFVRAYPQFAAVAGDLIVKNMDLPGASEMAERLKKTLPPGLSEENEQAAQIPPEVQTQIEQLGQMVEALTEQLNAASETIKTKKLELESKERIEFAKLETQLELEKLKQAQAFAIDSVNRQIADLQARQELVGLYEPISGVPQPPPQPSQEEGMAPPMEQQQGFEGGVVGPQAMPTEGFDLETINPTGGVAPGTFMEGDSIHGDRDNLDD